jgi:hypothetical protein
MTLPLTTPAFLTSACMLTPVAVASPRHLDPNAPACAPCPWPVLMRAPAYNPYQHRFSAADIERATRRCAEVAQQHPTWPRSRVRALVARELTVSTTQLRYLLRQGSPQEPTLPATDALAA